MMMCPGCGNPLYKGTDGAYLCEGGEYRYFLQLPTGREGNRTCLFLMLNPGTEKGMSRKAIEREISAVSSQLSGDTARCGRATCSQQAVLNQTRPSALRLCTESPVSHERSPKHT